MNKNSKLRLEKYASQRNVKTVSFGLLARQILKLEYYKVNELIPSKSEFIRTAIDDYSLKFEKIIEPNLEQERDFVNEYLEKHNKKLIKRLE